MAELEELTDVTNTNEDGSITTFKQLIDQINDNLKFLNNKIDTAITDTETKRKGYCLSGTLKDIFNTDTFGSTKTIVDSVSKTYALPFECSHGRVRIDNFVFYGTSDLSSVYMNYGFISQHNKFTKAEDRYNNERFTLSVELLEDNKQISLRLSQSSLATPIELDNYHISIELY